ncbi:MULTISPECIES: rod shape-determining protein MreD [unclassified Arsukibacterium]|uniref:rod shape-determining protein MreD n=1 Tax=unclassified Arsukibacterium TaxID=2635278 RepID=UPI000C4D7DC7|nr:MULTISPECIES: rod shape-determining protein MreD [unclassified Arsukibacterium]MAA95000.1 rod shape-determining protein MreD [Rheinheimera sp.]MBM35386.1 rod shape-determining protein MreD [Rheinheimera sp.]HAW94522.1 rod shape-determining protein MreD [Candidatus Azambacteria bacterium]|tara:strand:+ start:2630 stop:3112 length:483 start_codon:yes stop_codon:yes gene_type:complete
MRRSNGLGFIYLSLLVALLLTVMPMPQQVKLFRPDWALLVVLYWTMALPGRVNILTAFVLGFLTDVLVGTVLGVNALAFSVVTFIVAVNHLKIRNFSVIQQALLLGLFLALYHLLLFWLSHFLTGVYFLPAYLWPVLTGMLVWPWLFWLLRRYRRRFKIQ